LIANPPARPPAVDVLRRDFPEFKAVVGMMVAHTAIILEGVRTSDADQKRRSAAA